MDNRDRPPDAVHTHHRWIAIRRAQPANFLFSATRIWLASLPSDIRPDALATHYPRIANTFATCWKDDGSMAQVFDGLFVDRRGNRAGFPVAVQADLVALRRYWERLMAKSGSLP